MPKKINFENRSASLIVVYLQLIAELKKAICPYFISNSVAGNVAQGAVVNGTYDGQGLHFRWGDGSIFKCKELSICFLNNTLVRVNGMYSIHTIH